MTIVEYSSAQKLMEAVIRRIPQNYRTEEAIGIWQYRNRQILNDRLFVKSEGLIRNYMPAYGNMLSLQLYFGQDTSERSEELYRFCQRRDSVIFFDRGYWRALVGPEFLDDKLKLQVYNRPSDCLATIGTDFVNYMRKKSLRMFSKKSEYTMEAFSQEGRDYYRIAVAFRPKGANHCDTAIMVIDKEELAIVDAVGICPVASYKHEAYYVMNKWCDDMVFTTRMHWRYYKYDGKYQLDFIHREYDHWVYFSQMALEAGGNVHCLNIKGEEECILAEHTCDGVGDYKRRFFDNKHPRTEENIKETERVLGQPHSRIPW